MDDVLDYESASITLGKPGNADLQLGLATAPALYAWEEHPEMGELIGRKFEIAGDVEKVSFYTSLSYDDRIQHIIRLGILYTNHQQFHARNNLHWHMLMKPRKYFKSFLRARLEMLWRFWQSVLLEGSIRYT